MDIIGQHHAGYGYRRVTRKLRKMDILVSGKRVLHIMQRLGLAVEDAARKHRKQKALEPCNPRPYIVERVFSVKGKYRLRMGGIAYIATKEGWLYPLLTEPSRSNYFSAPPSSRAMSSCIYIAMIPCSSRISFTSAKITHGRYSVT